VSIVNPFHRVIVHTTVRALLRQCPNCHRKQVTAREKAREPVPCERCSTPIPAPRR